MAELARDDGVGVDVVAEALHACRDTRRRSAGASRRRRPPLRRLDAPALGSTERDLRQPAAAARGRGVRAKRSRSTGASSGRGSAICMPSAEAATVAAEAR